MKNILFVILISVLLTACKKENLLPEYRIRNYTPYQIESAVIKLGNSENTYAAINANQTSEYKSFSDSGYPKIKLRIDNRDIEFNIQPIEAAPPASGKNYRKTTWVITYNVTTNSFGSHFNY